MTTNPPIQPFKNEAAFQSWLMRTAKVFRWMAYHTHRSDRSEPGFPDTVLVRGERLIFAELKMPKGAVSEAQKKWLDALRGAYAWRPGLGGGHPIPEVYLWRPADRDRIIEILK